MKEQLHSVVNVNASKLRSWKLRQDDQECESDLNYRTSSSQPASMRFLSNQNKTKKIQEGL